MYVLYVASSLNTYTIYIYFFFDAVPNPYISPSVLSRVAAPPAFFSNRSEELFTIQIAIVLSGCCDIGNACVYIYVCSVECNKTCLDIAID